MCAQGHTINTNFDEFGGFLLVDLVQMQGAIHIYDWRTNKNAPYSWKLALSVCPWHTTEKPY